MEQDEKRRNFLKYLGASSVVVGTIGQGVLAEEQAQTSNEGKKPHYGMIFDQNKCVGCTECEVACHKIHAVPQGQARLYVQNKTDPATPMEKRYVRVSCQQCEDAPCVNVCPTKACHRDEKTGIVTMNADDWIACKYRRAGRRPPSTRRRTAIFVLIRILRKNKTPHACKRASIKHWCSAI